MKTHDPNINPVSEYYVYTPSITAKKLFFYLTHIGYYHYDSNYYLKRSNFQSFLIMLILDGECDVKLDTQSFHVKKGSLVLLDCYAPHEYGSTSNWKTLWFHFDGPLARNYYDYLTEKFENCIQPTEFHMIYTEIKEMFYFFQSGNSINEMLISEKITYILNHLIALSPNDIQSSHEPIKDSISYINEHFSEPITLNDLAKNVCLSPFYFTRIFSKETGVTPYQYLISTRISAAKFLLKSTSFSIKEIGEQCGFHTFSSFCYTFKKWENQTPSMYRKSV